MRRQVEYQLAGARASALAHTPGVSCQLAPSVDGLLRAVARLHTERGLHVTNGIADEPTVRCSREDVEEMLGNLLDNACKWGRGQVRVTSQVEGAHVVIAVEDDGPGLDPSLTEAVLGRGVRADERVPGSGLGLAIVRQLAELYGGSIGLSRSTLGGVCARLALPKA